MEITRNVMDNLGGVDKYTKRIKNNSYKLRLMGDEELKAKSEIIFTYNDLISTGYTLDSAMFGCTNLHHECGICGQNVDNCPGHMGCIVSPFPFVKVMCAASFKTIIEIICPICSNIPLPERLCVYIKQFVSPEYRIAYIKKKLLEYKSNVITCPYCKNKIMLLSVYQKHGSDSITNVKSLPGSKSDVNDPLIYVEVKRTDNESLIINPIAVHSILQNFTQYDLIGWPETYNVGDFMTYIVPIIPNKLRMKSIDNSVSIITTFYKNLVEEIIPELGKIYKILSPEDLICFSNNTVFQKFTQMYNKLMAYYNLISDATSASTMNKCLDIANKNDRKHFDAGVSLIGRIKDKENSFFNKGIINTRVDDSCRSVLGGAPDSKIMDIIVPNYIANNLTMKFNVFEENIKTIKQIIASMSDNDVWNNLNIPHVLFIEDCYTHNIHTVKPTNALSLASIIKPGDKVDITLINGYFIMHCRFPSIREESWTSQRVKRSDGYIVSVPLSICGMKGADFDGDESQIYVSSNTCYQLEALLLHSCNRMPVAYKDGNYAIWYSADANYGIPKIKQGKKSIIRNFECVKEYNVVDRIEKVLPKDLNYSDNKTVIKNGKFVENNINLNNQSFMHYVQDVYGSNTMLNIMDEVIQTAYDMNRNDGITLGFELSIFDENVKKELSQIRNELYDKLKNLMKSESPDRFNKLFMTIEEPKMKIQKLLTDQSKNSSIASLGFLPKYASEYSHVVNQLDFIKDADGNIFKNMLAENTRTLCTFPKYSFDPCAYGYVTNGYDDDINPVTQFYGAKSMRKTLYIKGADTIAKQGYLQKRLSIMHSTIYADFNYAMVDNNKLISLVYGPCGCDPRKYIKQPLIDITMEKEEWMKKYKNNSSNYKKLLSLYDEIHSWITIWNNKTNDYKIPTDYSMFASGFDWMQYIKQNTDAIKDSNMNDTYYKLIDSFINDINDIMLPVGMRNGIWKNCWQLNNTKHHEYFFRILFGYMFKLTKNIYNNMLTHYVNMLCNGGEPLGMKAANSIAEPMSQIVLKAIHGSIGGTNNDNVKRMSAFDAFETLLGGKKPKEVVITIGLYNDDYESSKAYAEQHETIYINDIWTKAEIIMSNEIDDKIIKMYENEIDFNQLDVNKMHINMIINMNRLAAYNVHITEVFDKLTKAYPKIMFICGYVLNASEFKALIYFIDGVNYDEINHMLEEWSVTKNNNTLIHGCYLKNCYVCENKNNPGHYIIQANEENVDKICALQNLIFDPLVDPYKCSSTDIDTCYELFGCNEANARHILECVYTSKNMSATSGLLISHYKLISDNSFSTGYYLTADRYSLKDDMDNDPLRLISYETPKDFLINTLKSDRTYTDNSLVSSTFFGYTGSQFSGDMVSKIMLYEVPK